MDIDSAKENIQPLAGGRNISLLQFALNAEKRQQEHDELIARRRQYEEEIKGYQGDDPLELWLEYIHWIEQAFPRNGKESEFQDALQRCLQLFEHEDTYKQDVRMVKMYIKFIDSQPQTNRHEYFSFLFHQGIGTMVADLYLAWAYYFEAVGSFAKADEIYKMGLGARAQPLEMLKHAQTQLHIMAAEGVRCQGDEEYNSKLLAHMGERRFALTSLRGQTKKQVVGSLRTDAAVKSRTPGLVLQSNAQTQSSNVGPVHILPDAMEESSTGLANASSVGLPQMKSVVESAIKAQENICEPGPWSQCGQAKDATKKQGSLFSKKEIASEPGFEICEDSLDGSQLDDEGEELPKLQLPTGFVRRNEPQDDWQVPMTIAEESKAVPMYIKKFVYPPALPQEFSLEEVRTYKWWTRRMIRPDDVRVLREMDSFMGAINLPENFAAHNQPQTPFNVECYTFGPEDKGQPMCRVLSATTEDRHKTFEDLLKERFLSAARERREKDRDAPTIFDATCMELDDMDVEVEDQEQQQGDFKPAAEEEFPRRTSDTPFGFNESCSTQIFNLFIKPQSISTPNRGKAGGGGGGRDKQSSAVPRSSLSLYRTTQQQQQQARDEIILDSSMEDRLAQTVSKAGVPSAAPFPVQQQPKAMMGLASSAPGLQQQNTSPDQLLHYGAKQLSVIMETTESSALSGNCHTTTTTDATITKCGDTRFGAYSSSSSSSTSSTIDYGVLSLTAKPRKSILKRPEVSVVELPESPPQAEQFTIFEDDEEEGMTKKGNDPFLVPSVPPAAAARNVSVYRETMDFFGAPPPPKMGEFAMPLPPKPKTFMPLYNDSMEQFMEKAKTVPRIPIVSGEEGNGAAAVTVGNNSLFAEESIFSQMPDREESIVAVPAMPDFSIFHDSMMGGGTAAVKEKSVQMGAIPKDRSRLFGLSAKENQPNVSSFSPLESFMLLQNNNDNRSAQQHNNSDDSGSLLDSPHKKSGGGGGIGRSKDAIYGTSTESTMPTIALIDPLLLENSLTFPSMREITIANTTDGQRANNQSMFSKMQQQQSMIMPPLLMEESMTFNTLMTREGGEGNKSKASAPFNPNLSILALQKELQDDNGDFVAPPEAAVAPQTFDESMTFNSLMRKEKGLPAIIGGVEGLRFEASAEPTTNLPKPRLLNDSVTFNSLSLLRKKGDDDDDLFLKPLAAVANPNQSSFPMELPSSTAHGFSIFTNKNAFAQDDHAMRMEQSISPIPSVRHDEMDDLLQVEGEGEKEPQQEESIYKWENALRVLPEADEPDRDSWYNANLDVTAAAADQQRKNKNRRSDSGPGDRPKRIGDREYVDPFDADLINDCLASVDFVNYVHKLNECDMKETIPPLRQGGQLELCEQVFSVRKLIGKGAFGQIYSAKTADGRLVALKQSRPCNLWEYYICMEVKFRLKEFNEDLLPALIDVEYALVARNASVFVLPFCGYGNLINICNDVKRATNRNMNEKVVMVLVTQILTIIDALHACQIIHADIKPDNFMLMGPIEVGHYDRPVLKLIDFGQAIDMQLFPPDVEFSSSLATDGFTCSEMLEGRPWTYQTDLFCVAGTIHTLLLGKYMAVQKGVCGYSVAKFPRYLQKVIWDEIFEHLLNVTDCKSMPNLQQMKLLLKQHISDNESATLDEVRKFNQIVNMVQVLDK